MLQTGHGVRSLYLGHVVRHECVSTSVRQRAPDSSTEQHGLFAARRGCTNTWLPVDRLVMSSQLQALTTVLDVTYITSNNVYYHHYVRLF